MKEFMEGHAWFTGAALILLLLSILCRFITGMLLKKLIKEAENMSSTENRLLKQCKLKFQNCYKLNKGAVNVSVFVDKFMQGIHIGKCSLRLLNQLSGQFLLLSVFSDGIGSCLGIIYGETLGDILPYYLLAFLSLYLHFSVSGLIDVPGKQASLRITITDFLENRMSERLKGVERDTRYLEEEEKKVLAEAGKTEPGEAGGTDDERQSGDAMAACESVIAEAVTDAESADITDGKHNDGITDIRERGQKLRRGGGKLSQEEELEELIREFLA